jgi:hypothetical protein
MITEKAIQDALYRHLRVSFTTVFPNMDTITNYEADVLAVSRAGYAYEYEIKISLADFRADMKKVCKHASLSGKVKKIPYPYDWNPHDIYVLSDAPEDPFQAMRNGTCYPEKRPKQFWYVIHGFDVPDAELPTYAGLMKYAVPEVGLPWFETIKQAPNLPAKKVDKDLLHHATANMLFRYWSLRLREDFI